MGWLANSKIAVIKSTFIWVFMHLYPIDLSEAQVEDPTKFTSFNDFFTRQLKPTARPIAAGSDTVISPVDGTLVEFGQIDGQQLIQAKDHYFSLESLLASRDDATHFENGQFATLYLAPHNYHRVHMPIAGKLVRWRFIPGKLYSVNQTTTDLIPNLYAENERLVCFFESEKGPFALVFVGAMIVGSIQLSHMNKAIESTSIVDHILNESLPLNKGDELGLFKLGSTVVEVFPSQSIVFSEATTPHSLVKMGQALGKLVNVTAS